jgi:hypothetical protein
MLKSDVEKGCWGMLRGMLRRNAKNSGRSRWPFICRSRIYAVDDVGHPSSQMMRGRMASGIQPPAVSRNQDDHIGEHRHSGASYAREQVPQR